MKLKNKKIIILFLIMIFSIPFSVFGISEVSTGDAVGITDTTAILRGSLNPNGIKTSGYFRYSTLEIPPIFCNDIFGSKMKSTFEVNLTDNNGNYGNTPVTFTSSINNLDPGATYYYCAVGSSNNEISYGGPNEFTTNSTAKITITTENASVSGPTTVNLNGRFNSNVPSSTWFEYRKISTLRTNPWIVVNKENHSQRDTGKLEKLLTGLLPGTTYEFKAVISDNSQERTKIKEGITINFKTKDSGNITPGIVPGGIVYEDPCANTDDINCNGTGNTNPPGGTTASRPDLTATNVTPVFVAVNTPTNLISFIKNQGGSSTLKSFYNFFQISLTRPMPPVVNPPTSGASSFNFFKTEKAFAAGEINAILQSINLPSIEVSALNAKSMTTITQPYTFTSLGKYNVRSCADKKSPQDIGLIAETYENNNCGPWSEIVVNLTGTGGGACPVGWTGIYPNCIGPSGSGACPVGWTGIYPNCIGPSGSDACPVGWTGIYPNCIGPGEGGGGGISPLVLGQTATPPELALVRYHEGIETVLQRQIVANTELAKTYGYEDGNDLQSFAWYLSDIFARTFGYVNTSGKEIRVTQPDIAAYQIDLSNGILTIYEYYDSKIVNIQKMTPTLRSIYDYEYYFRK